MAILDKVIGAGLSTAGSFIQYGLQKGLMNEQAKINKEQWERANAYNSPNAQMARFAQAGLNPDLIYGQMSDASTSNIVSDTGQASNPASTYASILNANLNREMLNADIALKNAQTQKLLSDTDVNKANVNKLSAEVQRMDVLNGLSDTQKQVALKQIEVFDSQISKMSQEVSNLISQNKSFDLDNAFKEIRNLYADDTFSADLNKVLAETQLFSSQSRKIEHEVNFLIRSFADRLEQIKLQNSNISAQTNLFQQEFQALYKDVAEGLMSKSMYLHEDDNGNLSPRESEQRFRTIDRVTRLVFENLGRILHINYSSFEGSTSSSSTHTRLGKEEIYRYGRSTGNGKVYDTF